MIARLIDQLRQNLPTFGFRPILGEPSEQVALPAFVVYLLDGIAKPQARGTYTITHTIAVDYLMPRTDPGRAYAVLSSIVDETVRAIWVLWENRVFPEIVACEQVSYNIRNVEWGGVQTIAAHFEMVVQYVSPSHSMLTVT